MREYFSIGFIDFILEGKRLLDFTGIFLEFFPQFKSVFFYE